MIIIIRNINSNYGLTHYTADGKQTFLYVHILFSLFPSTFNAGTTSTCVVNNYEYQRS